MMYMIDEQRYNVAILSLSYYLIIFWFISESGTPDLATQTEEAKWPNN
jgi:hypothetical protein